MVVRSLVALLVLSAMWAVADDLRAWLQIPPLQVPQG